jgi:hypothetical protein
VVVRDTNVCGAFLEQREHRIEHPANGGNLDTIRVAVGRQCEEVPEELVGPVDERSRSELLGRPGSER